MEFDRVCDKDIAFEKMVQFALYLSRSRIVVYYNVMDKQSSLSDRRQGRIALCQKQLMSFVIASTHIFS